MEEPNPLGIIEEKARAWTLYGRDASTQNKAKEIGTEGGTEAAGWFRTGEKDRESLRESGARYLEGYELDGEEGCRRGCRSVR